MIVKILLNWLTKILIFVFIFNRFCSLASAQILISEVQPNPTSGGEWVELYNTATIAATLANHVLNDQLTTPSVIFSFGPDSIIEPNQYLLIDLPSQKLNNGGDGVTLINAAGIVVDQMQFESSEPGKTWSRKSWDSTIFLLTSPTPGAINLIPTPTPTPTPIPSPSPSTTESTQASANYDNFLELTALYPCPYKDELEWVEVFNYGQKSINLSGWRINDEQNNYFNLPNKIISAQKSLRLDLSRSILNNSGDTAFLVDRNSDQISSITYSNCTSGQIITGEAETQDEASKSASTSINEYDSTDIQGSQSATIAISSSPKPPRPTIFDLSTIRLTDPSPMPTPLATYFSIPPVPSKKHLFSGILGGMFVAASGMVVLPSSRFKKIFNL
jgi:hypothetical protein